MTKHDKKRFYARIDGINREIFSVTERPDQSLILFSGKPRYWEKGDGSPVAFREQHYSVHNSGQGRDTTLTQKTTLEDGTRHSIVTYIHETHRHLLWPVHARRVPIFEGDSCLLRSRAKDETIKVAEFAYQDACLAYTAFVARPALDTEAMHDQASTFYAARLHELQVLLVCTFMNVPSVHQGDVVGLSTSQPVTNGHFEPNHLRLRATSIPTHALLSVHWRLMGILSERTMARVSRIVPPEQVDIIRPYAFCYSKQPLAQ